MHSRSYLFDKATSRVFCLVGAPRKQAAIAVDREAHRLAADEIVEAKAGGERSNVNSALTGKENAICWSGI